jgi:hypothetical protein
MSIYLDSSLTMMKSSGKKRALNEGPTVLEMLRGNNDDNSAALSTSFETAVK